MKPHLPQSLFKALTVVFACFSVSEAAVAIPADYTTVQINSAEDFAAFTPVESEKYAFVVENGVSLQGTNGSALLPAGSVFVQANGAASLVGESGEGNESYLFFGDSLTLTGDSMDIRGWEVTIPWAQGGTIYGAIGTTNLAVQDTTGTVRFRDCKSTWEGSVIYVKENGSVVLSGNKGSVSFENNSVSKPKGTDYGWGKGGAIYLDSGSTLDVSDNASVSFSGNSAHKGFASDGGGAICADVTSGKEASIDFSGNGRVEFSNNVARGNGGAIYGHSVSFTGNGEVLFSGNQANQSTSVGGGGIYVSGSWQSLGNLTIDGNKKVSFIGNGATKGEAYGAGDGGAIKISGGGGNKRGVDFSLSNNGDVLFSGNTARDGDAGRRGGAIFAEETNVRMEGNTSLVFQDNQSYREGGAIHTIDTSLRIAGNDTVVFRGNSEYYTRRDDGSYGKRLRSIYMSGGTDAYQEKKFELDAKKGGSITFYDSVYVGNIATEKNTDKTVSLNAEGEGDIVFSGKYVSEDWKRIFETEATAEEVRISSTSEIHTATVLHGGRLVVRDGATLNVDNTLTVGGSGKAATVLLRSGTLNLNNGTLDMRQGSSLSLAGNNSITVNNLSAASGSTWTFELSSHLQENSLLNLSGTLLNGSNLTINLQDASSLGGKTLKLLTVSSSSRKNDWANVTWKDVDKNITWTGTGQNGLSWVGNTLQLDLTDLAPVTEYWVNDGTDVIYADDSAVAGGEITQVVLNSGTFTMEENLNEGVAVRVDQNSTVKLEQGVTLNSSSLTRNGGSVVLDGSGVYNLGNSTDLKGSSFAETWQGEVVIGNSLDAEKKVTVTNLNLGEYGQKGSSVVLKQLDGSLKNGMNVESDVTLEGDGEAAVALKKGEDKAAYTFAGAVKSASGASFVVDAGDEQNFLFSGDVSEWKGLFQTTHDVYSEGEQNGVTNVTFRAAADAASADIGTTIRAALKSTMNLTIENAQRDVNVTGIVSRKANPTWNQADGKMNVTVDTVGHTTAFRNTLEVDSLTVKEGSTVKVGAEGSEGVVVTANKTGSDAVLKDVLVSQNALTCHEAAKKASLQNAHVWIDLTGAEQTASLMSVRVLRAGAGQAALSNMELVSSCVEVAAGNSVNLDTLALDANSSVILSDGSSARMSGPNSLVVTNVVSGGTDGVWTLETNQLAGVEMVTGANLTLGVELAPRDGGMLEILLRDFKWQSLTSGTMTSDNPLLEAFSLKLMPSGLQIAADMAEVVEAGMKVSFKLVPEPTTATLGLLALGLLAGHRRRK